MNARFVALVAGVGFFFLAVVTQGILPFVEPTARTTRVTAVVRTELGQLKWLVTEATDYTPSEQLGRRVYLREGCWYCHSQYVRPVTGETRRWGPVSEAGEYAFDVPHLFGTRRIGPDLTRRAQIRQRVASRPFLESAQPLSRFDHGSVSGAI
jgi:cytochrome c oxidase cbb3-type subunit 2